ncbi:hypothetical protein BCR34DRAFT_593459 [Clohesyomyces aquaticus]|uniref:Uncharacterized protein n=1 Tax=Clohesyomyces aquaticus TaxID=1231657 RepID=A0A1Y1YHP8_9PLEO|nr:hypothetical protein BCR34DRAFT_593459 [Clohesyomyces aquaticus]
MPEPQPSTTPDAEAATRQQDAANILSSDKEYLDYVAELALFIPTRHLDGLLNGYRHMWAGRICVVDTCHPRTGGPPPAVYLTPGPGCYEDLLAKMKSLCGRGMGQSSTSEPETRLFMVEDLCPQLLELVGQAFRFPHPEIFANHLMESGHTSLKPPSVWTTQNLEKPFASIAWLRPVRRLDGEYGLDISKNIWAAVNTEADADEDDDSDENIRNNLEVEAEFLPFPWMVPETRKKGTPKPRPTTNILRDSISLSATPHIPDAPNDVPFAWEEKATMQVFKHDQYTNVLLLLDPSPILISTSNEDEKEKKGLPYKALRKQRHTPWTLTGMVNSREREPFHERTNPTAEDVRLTLEAGRFNPRHEVTNPVLALLRVIRQDTNDCFALMSESLEAINTISMDDFQMQENLNFWRMLMNRMQKVVQTLTGDLRKFVEDIHESTVPDEIHRLVVEVETSGEKLMEKIRQCSSNLRADMSLLESRRGIAEAESVTRLTELAFIFIPLSFVSSLFSMQVNELASGVPLTSFIYAALITTFLIYGLRLLVRTTPFKSASRVIVTKIRDDNKLGPNQPIPFSGILKSIWYCLQFVVRWAFYGNGQVWTFWLFFTAAGLSIIPVALLWTQSKMDVSFKAIGTIILVPVGFTFAWLLASYLMSSDNNPPWSVSALRVRVAKALRSLHRRERNSQNSQNAQNLQAEQDTEV